MTMSGFVANLQDALTRVIVCLIPINRLTGYLSGIGANYDEAYRKKVTYTRCIIVSIYAMSPFYVFGGLYPKILFTHQYAKNLLSVNAYDDTMSHLATLYCMIFSIMALRVAIPLDDSIEAAVQEGTPVGNTQPTNASSISAEESVSSNSARVAPGVKAMSPEMKNMQQQMQDLMKKFSSSTSALDNAGESMRQMQAKINALEKEIAIAKHEKDQMTLEHQQGLANVQKQQAIFENKMQKQEMKMKEHMAEFEARDAIQRGRRVKQKCICKILRNAAGNYSI